MQNTNLRVKEAGFIRDVAILKDYGGKITKLTICKSITNSNVEIDDRIKANKGTVNDSKLENNIQRAKSTIFELAICNPWQYFATFTIDKSKYNRYDLEQYHKTFSQWIRNYNKKYGTSIKYLTIPEQHKDGAWHEHGFILGLPAEHLRMFTLEEKLPTYIREKLQRGEEVYDWTPYREKFGYVDFEPIRHSEAVSKYVTKYINKDLSKSITEINAHMFYHSKGLEVAKVIKRGTMFADIEPQWDFENEYVKVLWIRNNTVTNTLSKNILSDIDITKSKLNIQLKPLKYLWKQNQEQVLLQS